MMLWQCRHSTLFVEILPFLITRIPDFLSAEKKVSLQSPTISDKRNAPTQTINTAAVVSARFILRLLSNPFQCLKNWKELVTVASNTSG